MIRSVLAVLGSYVFLAVAIFVLFAIAMFDVPKDFDPDKLKPTTAFLVVSILWGFACAIAAGYLAGLLAGRRPLEHALGLAVVAGLIGVISLAVNLGSEPVGYQLGNLTVLLVGSTIGGWLRAQRMQRKAVRPPSGSVAIAS